MAAWNKSAKICPARRRQFDDAEIKKVEELRGPGETRKFCQQVKRKKEKADNYKICRKFYPNSIQTSLSSDLNFVQTTLPSRSQLRPDYGYVATTIMSRPQFRSHFCPIFILNHNPVQINFALPYPVPVLTYPPGTTLALHWAPHCFTPI